MPTTSSPSPADNRSASLDGLWVGLIDDAAALPPVGAALPDVLAGHLLHRRSWYADLVGPLLVPASVLADLLPQVPAGADLRLGVVADTGLAGLVEALGLLADLEDRVTAQHAQIALPRGFPAAESAAALLDQLALSTTTYVEVPATGYEGALDVLADDAAERVAYRLGGPPEELAGFVLAVLDRRLGFRVSGGMEHGALNVLAAVAAGLGGAGVADLVEVLVEPSAQSLIALVSTADRRAVRAAFTGFDCAQVAALAADLAEEGLVAKS